MADTLVRVDLGRKPGSLPSRPALRAVMDGLREALYPGEIGPPDLAPDERRRHVERRLDAALTGLAALLRHEPTPKHPPDVVVHEVLRQQATLRDVLDTDVAAAVAGDPAAQSVAEVIGCYPGFLATLHHRIAHLLWTQGATLTARAVSALAHADTAIDIHPAADIGEAFFIDHGTGVVIGETSRIGTGVRLYQGVTLGARDFPVDGEGRLVRGLARHPILQDDVRVFAGATLLGRITVGRGAIVGGGVWLTRDVPAGGRVTQAPARTEAFSDGDGI